MIMHRLSFRILTKTYLHQTYLSGNFPSAPFNCSVVKKQLCTTAGNIYSKACGMPLLNYIKKLETEYEDMKSNPNALQRMTQIKPIIDILQERRKLLSNIAGVNELLSDNDEDLKKLAVEERNIFEQKLSAIDHDLEEALLNIVDEDICNSIVLEVNAGVGGQEAMLFANELFDMYCGFIEHKGWQYEIADYITTDLGGIRHGSLLIDGPNVYRYFKYEAGVHRVQRIPATEKAGRIHTSTASVLALPRPTDIQIEIQSKDLRFETKRASGAGGQHVNTTDSAVRIVHLPTGICVECQVDRSQIKNREIALQKLRAKLYQDKLDKQLADVEATKKSQVRSNFRNEKIRTYNFSQDRISDHRLQNFTVHNLRTFFQGREHFESLSDKLDSSSKVQNLLRIITDLDTK